jgi:hypothetical protein
VACSFYQKQVFSCLMRWDLAVINFASFTSPMRLDLTRWAIPSWISRLLS